MEYKRNPKVIQIGNTFYHEDEYEKWKQLAEDLRKQEEDYLLWGKPFPEQNKPIDNRKWALVKVGGEPRTLPVDNKTMKCYDTVDHYTWTWNEIPEYEFIRWARGMDL